MKTKVEIRKYTGGGLGDLGDPKIPKAKVEVYLRSREGETFYVPTLAEGIVHLLSNKGFRLTVTQWPEGAGFDKPHYELVIYRSGNELEVEVRAPGLKPYIRGKIEWDEKEIPLSVPSFSADRAHPGIEVISPDDLLERIRKGEIQADQEELKNLEEILEVIRDLPPLKPEDLFTTEEVVIDPEE